MTDQMWHGGNILESSPVPGRAPSHADDCVVDIRDLEDYINRSKTGESSPFLPEWKQGPSKSTSLCGAVGSLASMPFRYLSSTRTRSNIVTKDTRCHSSDGCSTVATEEAISSYTPFQPENSSDFLRSENSSDSHDNSLNIPPYVSRDELESSLSALSIGQSQSMPHDPLSGNGHESPTTGAPKRFSWMGALKGAVTRSSQPRAGAARCAPSNRSHCAFKVGTLVTLLSSSTVDGQADSVSRYHTITSCLLLSQSDLLLCGGYWANASVSSSTAKIRKSMQGHSR